MKAQFNPAFSITVGLEGSYSNDPLDPGGPTKFGIEQAEARAYGYMGDMQDFPIETAQLIYKAGYWNPLGLDTCDDQQTANEMFDAAVNCGVGTAAEWMQRALNALGKDDGVDTQLWPLLTVDGHFGVDSMTALNLCLSVSPHYTQVLQEAFNCLKGASYIMDTEKNAKLRRFFLGWISNRITL